MADETQRESATLEASIDRARRVLVAHHDYLRGNEMATRALVIDVVLDGLGWNIRNPERVRLEHRVNGKHQVDYALVSTAGGVSRGCRGEGRRRGDSRQARAGRIGVRDGAGSALRRVDERRSMGGVGHGPGPQKG